jgi:hypothetical protein
VLVLVCSNYENRRMKKRIQNTSIPIAVCIGFLLGILFGFLRSSV